MANDFMNCRIRTSLRLLGMPHKKNSAVTKKKGTSCPAGKSGRRALVVGLATAFEACIGTLYSQNSLSVAPAPVWSRASRPRPHDLPPRKHVFQSMLIMIFLTRDGFSL